jgi:hypothetical protein
MFLFNSINISFGYKMNCSFYVWIPPLFTFKTQFYWSRNYMLFVSYSCNCVYKHSIKLFPSSFLDQCFGYGWVLSRWENHENCSYLGMALLEASKETDGLARWNHFSSVQPRGLIFTFVLPLAFVIVATLEDDDDGDGGLAYWNHFPLFCFPFALPLVF